MPTAERNAQDTLTRAAGRIGFDMGINIFKEFWPGIKNKMGGHSKAKP